MRRYAVRFLVAVLTFGIGVALSLAFGLFRVQDTKFGVREWSVSTCRKRIQVHRPAFLTIDTQSTDPLKLVYLGRTSDLSRREDGRMRFSVENRSNQIVTGYWITARQIWGTNGKLGVRNFGWTSNEVLNPGESSTTMTLPPNAEGVSLRVDVVNFQDGPAWTNPRGTQ